MSDEVSVKPLDEDDYREIYEAARAAKQEYFKRYALCDIPIQEQFDWWVMKETEKRLAADLTELETLRKRVKEMDKALEVIHQEAMNLAQFVSYAEIVGAIGHNRSQIRKHCDNIFSIHKEKALAEWNHLQDEDTARRVREGGKVE